MSKTFLSINVLFFHDSGPDGQWTFSLNRTIGLNSGIDYPIKMKFDSSQWKTKIEIAQSAVFNFQFFFFHCFVTTITYRAATMSYSTSSSWEWSPRRNSMQQLLTASHMAAHTLGGQHYMTACVPWCSTMWVENSVKLYFVAKLCQTNGVIIKDGGTCHLQEVFCPWPL